MIWFFFALCYAAIGCLFGVGYAFFTGSVETEFVDVLTVSVFLGPAALVGLLVTRKIATEYQTPAMRPVYDAILGGLAAPILIEFAAMVVGYYSGDRAMAAVLHGSRFWSIPVMFVMVIAYAYISWRLTRHLARRTPPPSSDGSAATTEQRGQVAAGSLPRDEHGCQMVACFSSRGTPFRLVRRPV